MTLDTEAVLRPSDYELVRAQSARLRRSTGIPIVFAGLRDGHGIRVTVSIGHRTNGLHTIHVTPSTGLGGLTWRNCEPTIVRNYGSSREITHDFDAQILGEGITDLIAAPFVVNGVVRGLIYGGFREMGRVEPEILDHLTREAVSIAAELRIRDEVDRRVSALVTREQRQQRSSDVIDNIPEILRQLRDIAANSADLATRRRLEDLIQAKNGPRPQGPRVQLTPRQIQVLSCVQLGFSNREVAAYLGLTTETVKTYLRAAMVRLDARTRHEAVIRAWQYGHTLR